MTSAGRRASVPFVSVVILNYNGLRFAEECIRSVLESDYPNFEVVVVDNGSTDGSFEALLQSFGTTSKMRIVRNSRNLGFAEGNNVGYKNCRGDVLVFLNVDTVAEQGWLRELVDVLNSNATIGVAQPNLIRMGQRPSVDSIGGYMDYMGYIYLFGSWYATKPTRLGEPFYAEGAALAIKRPVAEAVSLGGSLFDPDYFLYYEDSDLCWRVRLRGFTIAYAQNSIVHHLRAYATRGSGDVAYNFTRNHITTLIKNYSLPCLLRWLPPLLIVEAVHVVLLAPRAPRTAFAKIRAISWCLKNLRPLWRKRLTVQRLTRLVPDSSVMEVMLRPDVHQLRRSMRL